MTSSARSISTTFILWLSAGLCLFWLLAVGLGLSVMREEFGEIFDSSLQETAERLVPLVVDDLYLREDQPGPRRVTALVESAPDEYLTYQVRGADGRVLIHSHNVSPEAYDAPLVPGFWSDEKHRIFTVSAVSGSVFVQVADSLDHRREAALEGGTALLLPILVLLPLSIAAIWWIVRRVLAPVDQLRLAIAEKDEGNLSAIALIDLPRELQPILHSVNSLMGRLTSALEAERQLTANSAHELRTPIAGAAAQVQLLLDELDDAPQAARAREVERALKKLSALNEKLLQLARAEAGIGLAAEPSDLTPVARLLVEEFNRSSIARDRIRLYCDGGKAPNWPVDPDAFAIVLRNLVENALLHGLQGAMVDVEIDAKGCRVTNRAELLSPEKLSEIRKRFARANDRAPGSGLGLAIADRLMDQMGGRLDLQSLTRANGETVLQASMVMNTGP
ncbi:sensor histidine kinase [Rhizobium sp. FY34]|uniref:sensor histidine kinase n=1 Tax=Rhizobium sp. FY34 TaxID=2562309 RepID=UPI0010BFB108|nr:sensor histidine kinase [Rhizobium sp. FY34]